MHPADFGARKSGFEMSDLHNRSQTSARRGDYVWQYEYYDDEEPVSYEGLRAHRYSIVIGFWVGLAVFVIFMFFVLTLLTKTGAPHQESTDSAEKRHRPGSCLVDVDAPQNESDKAFSRPLLPVSRSYFNFHINEDERKSAEVNGKEVQTAAAGNRGRPEAAVAAAAGEVAVAEAADEEVAEEEEEALKGLMEVGAADRAFLSHFTIPNFVNLDHSSSLGEDDLLYEPSSVLERRLPSHD